MTPPIVPTGIRLGIARGITFGLFGAPEEIVAPSRALGAGLVRAYLYWSQIEPEPGRFDWTVVDALLEQHTGDEELWVTVCSSSLWATEQATDFLPPSPATDDDLYHRFVHALVARGAGRVQYWQCNNEPSNVGLLWSGTAADYVAQLRTFRRAVADADPSAAVVLGGCGYDVLSSPPDGLARRFFEHVVAESGDLFDLFAIHLYDDPALVPAHIELARAMMRAHGYDRPVIVGEYNGPTPFEVPGLDEVLQQAMAAAFSADRTVDLSTGGLAASVDGETPERRAMRALYAAMPELPEAMQMFMAGCAPELDERRDRINCREIVTTNLLALAAGVRRTVCWHLAPEVPNFEDHLTMMDLMHGKLPLLAYEGGRLGRRRPAADTFHRLAGELDGAVAVNRVEVADHPEVFAVTVEHPCRGPLAVLWTAGDLITGEDEAPTVVEWPWPYDAVYAFDVFGAAQQVDLDDGRARVAVSVTPVFVSADGRRAG